MLGGIFVYSRSSSSLSVFSVSVVSVLLLISDGVITLFMMSWSGISLFTHLKNGVSVCFVWISHFLLILPVYSIHLTSIASTYPGDISIP